MYINGIGCAECRNKIRSALILVDNVIDVKFKDEFTEVFLERDVDDKTLKSAVEGCGEYFVSKIE